MSHTIRRRNSHSAAERRPTPPRAPAVPLAVAPQVLIDARTAMVTDHAVVRWLERVTGIDVGRQVREEILADGREQLIPKIGNGKITIGSSDVVLQIRSGRVITVKKRAPHG